MASITELLAALGVDAAELSTYAGGQYACLQRDPQPDEDGIALDTAVRLLIVDLDTDPYAIGAFDADVYIAGVRALHYVGVTPTWENGWTGTVTASSGTDPFVFLRVEAQQPAAAPFASEQVVAVRVVVAPGPTPALDETYTFTVEDLTPPALVSAVALDARTVRLTFDDAMALTGEGSALAPDAYTVTRRNVDPAPAVHLDVTAAAVVAGSGDTQVDLTVHWEQTPGCTYDVAVAPAVTDSAGNGVQGPAVPFAGFAPAAPAGRRFSHWRHMVPAINRVEDDTGDLERFSGCVQEVLDLLLSGIDAYVDQFDPDRCADDALDGMLYDLGNPFAWEALTLSAAQRRKLVTYLVEIYRGKGTAVGIEQTILFLLGVTARVVPYQAEGWTLGVDLLGDTVDGLAEVLTLYADPFDFTAVAPPWDLPLVVDAGPTQTVTFVGGDFADPSAATAAEVSTAIAARATGVGTYVAADGAPALVVGTEAEPYALSGGEVLLAYVQDVLFAVTFAAADFSSPGAATRAEVLRVLQVELPAAVSRAHPDGGIALYTALTGDRAKITIAPTPGAAALGLAWGTYYGRDGARVGLYSTTGGATAAIACGDPAGPVSATVLGLWAAVGAGAGTTILAPSEQRALYTFDVEVDTAVDAETEQIIRDIANYLRAAHEHLANVRVTPAPALPDGWILGISTLDDTALLFAHGAGIGTGIAGGTGSGAGSGGPGVLVGFGHGPFGHTPCGGYP